MSTESSTAEMKTTPGQTTSMDVRQLHSSQQEALRRIVEFSGESNETDIDGWIYDLTNLFTLMKLKDETKILETMGKLTGSALRWYQEHLTAFDCWQTAEQALRDRFQEFTSDSQLMQEFFQLRQEETQTIISFYETVVRKYKRAEKLITEQQVITVLQAGVKNSIREHLIRNEKEITKPDEWLRIAKEEEYIQKRIQQQRHASDQEANTKPYFEPILSAAAVQYRPSNARPQDQQAQRQYPFNAQPRPEWKPSRRPLHHNLERTHRQPMHVGNKTQHNSACLICNRRNHATMDCMYKKQDGCFKCGQPNHRIRDCPQRHFFE